MSGYVMVTFKDNLRKLK